MSKLICPFCGAEQASDARSCTGCGKALPQKKKGGKILKKIWDITSTVIVVLFVLAAVILMGSRLLGFEVYNVISGSMEPTYSVGDLIYVKPVDPRAVKVGDPITFVADERLTVATHRVIEVDLQNECFYTKGDANDFPDQKPVSFKNLQGVPQFSIPLLGYVSDYIAHPPGTYVAIGAVVLMLILAFVPDMVVGALKKKKPEEPAQAVEAVAADKPKDIPSSEVLSNTQKEEEQ